MSSRYLSLYYSSLDFRRATVLFTAWLTTPFVSRAARDARLATAVRRHLGGGEVFAYATGRGALAAGLKSAGIGSGDKVVLSAFTCLAVPTAVLAVGATPTYVDIEPGSVNASAASVVAALGPQVRAVVVQHTMGSVAEVAEVVEAARSRNIIVIEDCALALGTRRDGKPVGCSADASIFSLELSKTISTGWGGVLVVHKPDFERRVAASRTSLRDRGALRTFRDIWQTIISALSYEKVLFPIGRYVVAAAFRIGLFRPSTPSAEVRGLPGEDFIAKLSSAQTGLATAQWQRLEQIVAASHANIVALRAALKAAGLRVLGDLQPSDISVSPRVAFLVSDPAEAVRWFASRGVELGRWFDGPLTPPPEASAFNYDAAQFPNAVSVARHVVNLPSHAAIDAEDRRRIVALVEQYAAAHPADRGFLPAAV